MNTIKNIIDKRKSLDVNDEIGLEQCWVEEADIILNDIISAISFINAECDDETLYWMSEVFEDVARKTRSKEFLDAIKQRVEAIKDEAWKESVLYEVEIADSIINQKTSIDDETKAHNIPGLMSDTLEAQE